MSDVILHDAHIRAFRWRNKVLWLADQHLGFRIKRIKEVKEKFGDEEAKRLNQAVQEILDKRVEKHMSMMAAVRRAVFG